MPPHSRDATRRVVSYDEVVVAARRHFLSRSTLQLDVLAGELAISRATLYRVIEGRDRLLGDVIWSLAGPLLERITARRLAEGGEAVDVIIRISLDFYESILAPGPFRQFLALEQDAAMRILFTPAGGVHERAVAQRAGTRLPDDLEGLGYLYVRIIESLLYGDLFAARTPDLALVERAARAILTAE